MLTQTLTQMLTQTLAQMVAPTEEVPASFSLHHQP
jgi:hypothetical protein